MFSVFQKHNKVLCFLSFLNFFKVSDVLLDIQGIQGKIKANDFLPMEFTEIHGHHGDSGTYVHPGQQTKCSFTLEFMEVHGRHENSGTYVHAEQQKKQTAF